MQNNMQSTQQHLSVSVIIPTYNRAAFIAAAIDSALDQTCPPDAIIVVDDGSTDETPEILARYGPPVRVIRQENRGRSTARNTGLRAATGDAVFFLDSDDMLLPHCIERCVRILETRPEVGVVYTDVYLCDGEGNRVGLGSQETAGSHPSGMVLGELARRNFLTVTSLARRSCIGDETFEEGRRCAEDYDFWRRLAVRCHFQYVNEPLSCYRFHDAMITLTQYGALSRGQLEVQRRILEMPEFEALTRRERSRAFCSHGIKHAMLGATDVARRYFWKTIRTSPTYPGGYVLLLLSLLGTRPLQYAIVRQRKLAGNRLGTNAGQNDLFRDQRPDKRASMTSPVGPLLTEGGRHG
jgi:Glycosyl transferase family 2